MNDLATLGLRVESDQVKKANDELRKFSGTAGTAERSAKGMSAANDNAARSASRMSSAYSNVRRYILRAAAAMGTFIGAAAALRNFITNTIENERAQAQLAAAIQSTGGAAQRSVQQLNDHAAALQRVSTFGDEAINVAQGLLLTFTQVQGDVFDGATEAVVDMATAMGTDLRTAAMQVGRALNDPVRGVQALTRSGIQFSDAQLDMIKHLVETNRLAEAQAIILGELEKQFGGSARAARDTLGGALQSLRNAWGDLFEMSRGATEGLRNAIEQLIEAIQDPSFVAFVELMGRSLFAALTLAARGIALVFDNLQHLFDLFKIFVAAGIIRFLIATAGAFVALARTVQVTGVAMLVFTRLTRAKITTLALLGAILAKVSGQYENFTAFLESTASAIWSALPEGMKSGLEGIGDSLKSVFGDINALNEQIGTSGATFLQVENDALSSFGSIGDAANTAGRAVADAAKTGEDAWGSLRDTASRAFEDMTRWVQGVANSFVSTFTRGIESGKSAIESLRDAALSMLQDITRRLIQMATNRLISGLLGSLFGGFSFAGPWGGAGSGGGLGGAFPPAPSMAASSMTNAAMSIGVPSPSRMRAPANSNTFAQPMRAAAGGGSAPRDININVNVDGARGSQEIEEAVQAGVSRGIEQLEATLPDKVHHKVIAASRQPKRFTGRW